ncbi:MAG: VOC family protein [Spirochaetes bacterium]|uniref:VOC family protein n=1 Tax=Candidatus Ornithospirochaeta stercoripullorum TaxID=2840899 RepID=A0A9D9DYR6_9SPIO|nr:VOC family protein [Candidatus Ornithospirochaeta stercoripullorum]
MKIEHIALYVVDLEREKTFFETYFGATAGTLYHNKSTGFSSYFLSFTDGARLEIMTSPAVSDDEKKMARSGFIHIAFSLGSRKNVDRMTERLRLDGYTVASGPRTTGDGYYESCVLDPEGNQIELTV